METMIKIESHKHGITWVRIDEKDFERVRQINWHVVRNKHGRIMYIAATFGGGRREYMGRNAYGKNMYSRSAVRGHQVKLHDYIMGEIPKCKAVRHRDGDPLNNTRENLALYKAYHTEEINAAPKRKRLDLCDRCKDKHVCRRVATRKRVLPVTAGNQREF